MSMLSRLFGGGTASAKPTLTPNILDAIPAIEQRLQAIRTVMAAPETTPWVRRRNNLALSLLVVVTVVAAAVLIVVGVTTIGVVLTDLSSSL